MRREREQRRRARLAKGDPEPDVRPPPRPPRRRAALLAHADRESVAAAVLLARELRLVDAIWIYPQAELMTFFRNVATDLREDTPIVVVGFTASPARETLQTASLYRDRLVWYDHHEWPPEDLEAMRQAIGADSVHVDAAAGSRARRRARRLHAALAFLGQAGRPADGPLLDARLRALGPALVVATRRSSRRGRASAARSSKRCWSGGRRSSRKQAARVAAPPLPTEVEWVAARDFRIVHFGGHALVRVPLPPEQDLHLAARVVRDRYRAPLSLAWTEGSDRFVLASDEGTTRRVLDLGSMVEHLAAKFEWVDGAARSRPRRALPHPGRGGASGADRRGRRRDRDGPLDPRRVVRRSRRQLRRDLLVGPGRGAARGRVDALRAARRLRPALPLVRLAAHLARRGDVSRSRSRAAADAHRTLANPVPVAAIVDAAAALELERHAFVSITGGEPLLQPDVVRALAEALRGRGPRIHLETHGLATAALAQVVDVVDVVSMDWKLASDVRREGESFKAARARLSRRARGVPARRDAGARGVREDRRDGRDARRRGARSRAAHRARRAGHAAGAAAGDAARARRPSDRAPRRCCGSPPPPKRSCRTCG